jgi:hypothetical protein
MGAKGARGARVLYPGVQLLDPEDVRARLHLPLFIRPCAANARAGGNLVDARDGQTALLRDEPVVEQDDGACYVRSSYCTASNRRNILMPPEDVKALCGADEEWGGAEAASVDMPSPKRGYLKKGGKRNVCVDLCVGVVIVGFVVVPISLFLWLRSR